MQLDPSSTLSLTAFTLYPITLSPIKTCYQSQSLKLLCSISGPYYDRTSSILPSFNIKISSNQNSKIKSLSSITQKIRQTLNTVIVKQKYQRMKFDVSFDIVENNISNMNEMALYAPFVNLLCYTVALNGLEVKSMFTCCGLSLVNQKKVVLLENSSNQQQINKLKSMVLGIQHLNKQTYLTIWEGQFVFLHYQRLTNILLSCNQQILQFIKEKINQTYDQFN